MNEEWKVGERIHGRWEIHKILRGGMGIVYIVYDYDLHEPFAAKTFQDAVFERSPQITERFKQEAAIWINLDAHENVVQARFVETIEGRPFVLLEYVSGGDLGAWIGTRRLVHNPTQVLRFAIQFCDGMIHAVAKGIKVHRDIKPQNCLITDGGVLKITDFGLAKAVDPTESLAADLMPLRRGFFARLVSQKTEPGVNHPRAAVGLSRTGTAGGTCTHMAPEQFDDVKHVDIRADIYSFGVVLHQMTTGQLPFTGRSWEDYEQLHKTKEPPVLAGATGDYLNAVMQRCLAKDPARRFGGFKEMRDRLSEMYREITGEPVPEPATGKELNAAQWNNKGVSLNNLGRRADAISCHDRALALNPSDALIWYNKAVTLGSDGEALACYDRAIALNPRLSRAWLNKGVVLESLCDADMAMKSYDRALELNPDYETAWLYKGMLFGALGDLQRELDCYERALAADPLCVGALVSQGTAFKKLGRMDEALRCYDRALAIDPTCEKAWYNKGVVLGRLGGIMEEIDSYDHAIEINPQYAQAWFNKGVALADLGRTNEEIACYDRAIAGNPNHVGAWFNKGVALVGRGCYRDAVDCFETAKRSGSAEAAERAEHCRRLLRVS